MGVWIFLSRQEVEHSVLLKHVRVVVKELQITRPKIDKLLNHYVMSHTSNVEEPGDEELVVLENQSQSDNTQDGNKKKGKGNNKGKKSSKSKDSVFLYSMCCLNEGAFTNRLQEQPLHLPIIEAASSKITKFEMGFLLSSSELIRIDEWIILPPATPARYQKWAIVGV
ncbi:hypothetical protein Tco_1046105 [Tanacetum coccineum]